MRVALTYQADPALPDCPTADDLRTAIAAQLGGDPFASDPSAAVQRVHVAIARQPVAVGTEAHITWFDQLGQSQGERRLSSASNECAELASGVVFAVAVQIQLRASEAQSRASAPPPPSAPPARAAVVRAPPRPPAQRQAAFLAGAGLYAQHGLAPGVTGGLRVFAGLAGESWALDVGVQATLPSKLQLPDRTGFQARDLGARLAPCWRLRPLGVCAVGALGAMYVRGEGVDNAASPSTLIAGVGGRLQLVWPALERFNVLIHGEALALLTPRDVLLNRAVVWSTAPIVLGAGVDLAAVFR